MIFPVNHWVSRILVCCLVLIVFLICTVLSALGAEFKLTPNVSVLQEYNDNLFFDTDNAKSDWITTLSAGLDMRNRTDRTDLTFSGRLDGIRHNSEHDLNSIDQFYQAGIAQKLSPLFTFSVSGGYQRDSRPDREIALTGLTLGPAKRDRYFLSADGEYTFSEKTAFSLTYGFGLDSFDSPRFTDGRTHSVNLGAVHDLSSYLARTKLIANIGGQWMESGDTKVDAYSGTIGLQRALTEKWSLTAAAGIDYINSEFQTYRQEFNFDNFPLVTVTYVPETIANRGWGWLGQMSLTYNDGVSSANLTFQRDISPATGSSGAAERMRLYGEVSRRFTAELTASLSLGYVTNYSSPGQYSAQGIDQQTLTMTPKLRYQITDSPLIKAFNGIIPVRRMQGCYDAYLEASYSYTSTRSSYADTNTRADQNLFMIRLYMQHNLLD